MGQFVKNEVPPATPSISKTSTDDAYAQPMERLEEKDPITTNTEKNSNEPQYATGLALYTVIGGLSLAIFLLMLDTTIVATSTPKITDQFNSVKDIGWYNSAYTLSISSLQLLFGKIYQLYNKKYSFMSAMALFELGSLICAVSFSSNMFIVGRAVAGCGGSGIYNGALTIIASSAPLSALPALIGVAVGTSSIGLAVGPLIGGALTEHVTWRWCFYINLPLGAMAIIALAFINVPNAKAQIIGKLSLKEQLSRLDLPGCALFIPSVIMLLLALNWGGTTYAWNSATIIGLFCGSFVNFCVFLAWEHYQGDKGILPLSIVRKSIVAWGVVVTIFCQGAFFLVVNYMPIWFQVVKGISPLSSGVHTLPSILSQIPTTFITGFAITKFGFYTPFGLAGSALAAVVCGLMNTFTPSSGAGEWISFQIISGMSRGFLMQVPITAVQANLSTSDSAIGTAIVTTCMTLGAAIFVSLGETILLNALRPALNKFAPGVNSQEIIDVGATAFRTIVSHDDLPGVVKAYNQAITTVFYLGIGGSCVAFFSSWGLGWKNLNAKKEVTEGDDKV